MSDMNHQIQTKYYNTGNEGALKDAWRRTNKKIKQKSMMQ